MGVYSDLLDHALNYANDSIIRACAIGENCLAVESSGGCGLSFVERDFWRIMPPQSELRELERELRGLRLSKLLPRYLEADPLYAGLALAGMNALFGEAGHRAGEFDLPPALRRHRRLGMVGCFHPLMPQVRASGIELVLFELQKLPGTHLPAAAPDLLPGCDLLVITASAFVNKTFHLYYPHIAPEAEVYILGPSCPLAPELARRFNLAGSLAPQESREEVLEKIRRGYSYRALSPYLRKVLLPRAGRASGRAGR